MQNCLPPPPPNLQTTLMKFQNEFVSHTDIGKILTFRTNACLLPEKMARLTRRYFVTNAIIAFQRVCKSYLMNSESIFPVINSLIKLLASYTRTFPTGTFGRMFFFIINIFAHLKVFTILLNLSRCSRRFIT